MNWPYTITFFIGVIIIAIVLSLTGCISIGPWEDAQPECLQYANAACIKAMVNGYEAGVVTCTLPNTAQRRAVTWVIVDGEKLYWDAAFHGYRSKVQLGTIHYEVEGPSRGAFDILPIR